MKEITILVISSNLLRYKIKRYKIKIGSLDLSSHINYNELNINDSGGLICPKLPC